MYGGPSSHKSTGDSQMASGRMGATASRSAPRDMLGGISLGRSVISASFESLSIFTAKFVGEA